MLHNTHSYFHIILKSSADLVKKEDVQKSLEDIIEPVLEKMNASERTYIITNKKAEHEVIFLFKTNYPKRINLLRNTLKKQINTTSDEEQSLSRIKNYKGLKSFPKKTNNPTLEILESLTRKQFLETYFMYKNNPFCFIKREQGKYKVEVPVSFQPESKLKSEDTQIKEFKIRRYNLKLSKRQNKILVLTIPILIAVSIVSSNLFKTKINWQSKLKRAALKPVALQTIFGGIRQFLRL